MWRWSGTLSRIQATKMCSRCVRETLQFKYGPRRKNEVPTGISRPFFITSLDFLPLDGFLRIGRHRKSANRAALTICHFVSFQGWTNDVCSRNIKNISSWYPKRCTWDKHTRKDVLPAFKRQAQRSHVSIASWCLTDHWAGHIRAVTIGQASSHKIFWFIL